MKYLLILFILTSCGKQLTINSKYKECEPSSLEVEAISSNSISLILDKGEDFMIFEGKMNPAPLKIIRNSTTIEGLASDTNYVFKAVPVSTGCESNLLEVKTRREEEFTSCSEIKEYDGDIQSGYFTLSIENTDYLVFCDLDNNGGGWTQVFTHNVTDIFESEQDALKKNEQDPDQDLYSILFLLDSFKKNGKFKFWLSYETDSGSGNIWEQSSNPAIELVSGYSSIREDNIEYEWGGLEFNGNESLMDGSVDSPLWWYAIGAYQSEDGQIPGPGSKVTKVTLFIQ